jgi:exodeoxyribonuclease-5
MMNKLNLYEDLAQNCPFKPTQEQLLLLQAWQNFLLDGDDRALFLLNGYAGTGKTSMVAVLVKTLLQYHQKVVLMAPTGRAAKVLSLATELPVLTIHRKIYRERAFTGEGGTFTLNNNLYKNTLFVVDEASMIAYRSSGKQQFGSGSLLDDLIQYVYSGEGCRLLLVGDRAQLPPVGETESAAMDVAVLEGYGKRVHYAELKEVVRQATESDILLNATRFRELLAAEDVYNLPVACGRKGGDVIRVSGEELIEALETSYYRVGKDQTVVVTRSNKRANIFNNGIRGRILDCEEMLSGGDHVVVAHNNYYWTDGYKKELKDGEKCPMDFIANGDVAVVRRVRNVRELYGFHFADVLLEFPDYNDFEIRVTVLLDTLQSESPDLTEAQQQHLTACVLEDYADLHTKYERIQMLKRDMYFNALRLKYAYAVTCHKAQGGQWQHVYLDQGYLTEDMISADYYRWLYTAFTRASEKLYLINWSDKQWQEQEGLKDDEA